MRTYLRKKFQEKGGEIRNIDDHYEIFDSERLDQDIEKLQGTQPQILAAESETYGQWAGRTDVNEYRKVVCPEKSRFNVCDKDLEPLENAKQCVIMKQQVELQLGGVSQ